MEEILFEAKMATGKLFRVYSNRFEINLPSLFSGKKIIPLRSISNIEKHRVLNKLIITTNDGEKTDVVFTNSSKVLEELLKFL
jgi:DNA polymerase III delta subunit